VHNQALISGGCAEKPTCFDHINIMLGQFLHLQETSFQCGHQELSRKFYEGIRGYFHATLVEFQGTFVSLARLLTLIFTISSCSPLVPSKISLLGLSKISPQLLMLRVRLYMEFRMVQIEKCLQSIVVGADV